MNFPFTSGQGIQLGEVRMSPKLAALLVLAGCDSPAKKAPEPIE